MRQTWWLMALVSGLCLVVLIGACGDDDSASKQDEDDVTAAIEHVATSGDPKACVDGQTQQFTEQTTGQKGKNAVEQCRDDAKDDPADAVEVSNLKVDGDSASADVAITGSVFGGQEIAVTLVKQNDAWKLDKLERFVDGFDREAFNESFKKQIANEKGAPPGAAACVQKNLAKLSDEQIDQLFIESNRQVENQVFDPCFRN